jgi:hypothetical protein
VKPGLGEGLNNCTSEDEPQHQRDFTTWDIENERGKTTTLGKNHISGILPGGVPKGSRMFNLLTSSI